MLGTTAQLSLARRGLLRLSLEGKCSGHWVVSFPSIVWLSGFLCTTPTGYTPAPRHRLFFLIFELIIYFSKPKDLSSSLIRGELFSFGWQALGSIGGDVGRIQKATLSLGCSGQRM